MKSPKLLLPFCALVVAGALTTAAGASAPIPVNPEKVLQVVVHDNVAPRARDSWTSYRMDRDRYLQFETAVEAAVKASGYKGAVKVTPFVGNLPDAEQRLSVFIYRWQTGMESFGSSFTAEFTMEALLSVGGQEFDLGSFSARESHFASRGPQADDFQPVARRAVDQMIECYRNAIEKR